MCLVPACGPLAPHLAGGRPPVGPYRAILLVPGRFDPSDITIRARGTNTPRTAPGHHGATHGPRPRMPARPPEHALNCENNSLTPFAPNFGNGYVLSKIS